MPAASLAWDMLDLVHSPGMDEIWTKAKEDLDESKRRSGRTQKNEKETFIMKDGIPRITTMN
jgi:hypothetical protein